MADSSKRAARARRRKQLARHPELVEAILGPPTRAAEHWLQLLGLQRFEKLLVFPPSAFAPGWARAAVERARLLGIAIESLQGYRCAEQRKAEWALGSLGAYLKGAVRRAPHLIHTRQTDQPWQGWPDDLARLAKDHPEWQRGIDADADYLGKVESSIADDQRMERKLHGLIIEARQALPYCSARQAAMLRPRIEALVEQHASFAAMLQPSSSSSLATMAVAGSA